MGRLTGRGFGGAPVGLLGLGLLGLVAGFCAL
jgi:F0F1-type ATP synthase assembly protein I